MSSVYISGPMSGLPGFNYDTFNELAANLREHGYTVINPAENFGGRTDFTRAAFRSLDISHVLEAACVMVLPEWETSRGSRLEVTVALEIGLKVYDTEWNEMTAGARAFLDGLGPSSQPVIMTPGRAFGVMERVAQTNDRFLELRRHGYTVQEASRIVADDVGENPPVMDAPATARTFATGATRNTDDGKLDYEGFLSPLVLRRFAEYMHACRGMVDGKPRASDNWQKGIPQEVYMKSMWRHFMSVWEAYRTEKNGDTLDSLDAQDELCALLFNAMGMLHEELK